MNLRHLCWACCVCLFATVLTEGIVSAQEQKSENPSVDDGEFKKILDVEREAFEAARQEKNRKPEPLTVGGNAPELKIEHFLHEGKNAGSKDGVVSFRPGRVYVIEFWATWCGPCVSSMPHIAKLQRAYADQGVTMISVTDEKLPIVKRFLERKVRVRNQKEGDSDADSNDLPKTYGELTSAYHLACDSDGSTFKDYMEAAEQNGIPAAFLVGKTGRVEWVGHPMVIDGPLDAVLNDKWDRDAFAEEFTATQKANRLLATVSRHMQGRETAGAVKAIDNFLATNKSKQAGDQFRMIKLRVLANDPQFFKQTSDFLLQWLAQKNFDSEDANELTWEIYELAASGDFENQAVLEAAIDVAKDAVEKADADSKCYIMDTVAHLQHFTGDHVAALATQTKAYEMADAEQKEQLVDFYEELKQLSGKPEQKNAEIPNQDNGPPETP